MATKKAEYSIQYSRANYKRIMLEIRKEYFSDVLKPASEMEDMAVATFIKLSIMEKIKRDGLDLPADKYKP